MQKSFKIILTILLLSFVLPACKSHKNGSNLPVIERETVIKETIVTKRDSVFFTRPDLASIKALLECDSSGNVMMNIIDSLSGEIIANISLNLKDNTITAECLCDSAGIYIQWLEKNEITSKLNQETKIIFQDKAIPQWKIFLMYGGVAFILQTILALFKRYLK